MVEIVRSSEWAMTGNERRVRIFGRECADGLDETGNVDAAVEQVHHRVVSMKDKIPGGDDVLVAASQISDEITVRVRGAGIKEQHVLIADFDRLLSVHELSRHTVLVIFPPVVIAVPHQVGNSLVSVD